MRISVHRFDDLSKITLRNLAFLTNSGDRGDVRDNGTSAGSLFRNQIDDRLMGESFPNSHVVLAKEHFKYAGWAMVTRHDIDPDTGRKLHVPSGQVGFYVHPDFRRQGLGRSLLLEAQEVARKTGIGRLLANPWNKSSAAFFKSVGFDEVECYVTGWSHGIAALDIEPAPIKVRVG